MELTQKFWHMFGPAGAVLVILALVSLYLSLRNGIYLYLVEKDFDKKLKKLQEDGCKHLKQFYHDSDNPLINIIGEAVLIQVHHSKGIRSEVSYLFHRNFSGVTSGLTYLRLISVVAPLLGLMGTMLGMIDVFRVVASSPTVDTTLFAKGIWEALTTTILGLAIAIPSLFFYYSLMLKMKRFRFMAVEHSSHTSEILRDSETFKQDHALNKKWHNGEMG